MQEGFNPGAYEGYADTLTASDVPPLEVIDTDIYYSDGPRLGDVLTVPADLEESLDRYDRLSHEDRMRFDRAAYWLAVSTGNWELSQSISFTSLVTAVETLLSRGNVHQFICPQCGGTTTHEIPGPTKQFRDFLETYAVDTVTARTRHALYDLRSQIVHGSDLMQLDVETSLFGSDARESEQLDLHRTLSAAVRTALRNWLHDPARAGQQPAGLPTH